MYEPGPATEVAFALLEVLARAEERHRVAKDALQELTDSRISVRAKAEDEEHEARMKLTNARQAVEAIEDALRVHGA